MEQTAQYDHIGSKYDEYARTATLKRAESYTFFRMVGELAGKRVLDLACGFGFYTKQLKQRGATQVVGVDSFRRGHVIERLTQDVRAIELFAGRTEALREAVADAALPRV